MPQFWTVTRLSDGVVLEAAFATPSEGSHPKDNGLPDWDSAVMKATRIPRAPRAELEVWSGTAWVEDAAKVEAMLVGQVKAADEALVKGLYSQNYGKQKKYSRKQQEVLDFRTLNGALGLPVVNALTATLSLFLPGFNALTASQQKKKFRFSMAQATKRGVSIDVIIGEMEGRLDTVEDQVASWEAIELEAIRAIKAAPTAAAKRAAFAAINWSWTA